MTSAPSEMASEEETPAGTEFHNENTLFKVNESLRKSGLDDCACRIAVNTMQNAGILFREISGGVSVDELRNIQLREPEPFVSAHFVLMDAGFDTSQSMTTIVQMQDDGILFRFRGSTP
jgi:hypothetical protein